MKISRNQKKVEALKRMHRLGIAGCIAEDFRTNDNVQIFETPLGIGYWPDDGTRKEIERLEAEHGILVYSGMRASYDFGGGDVMDIISFLYVSDHIDEWATDIKDAEKGMPSAYCSPPAHISPNSVISALKAPLPAVSGERHEQRHPVRRTPSV